MIRKSGDPVFPRDKRGTRLRGDHAQTKRSDHDAIPLNRIMIWRPGERRRCREQKRRTFSFRTHFAGVFSRDSCVKILRGQELFALTNR